MKPHQPERNRLVLVGGGHSHLTVLKRLGMQPINGLQVTLVAKELNAPYSGMLPGLIAGNYAFEQCHVDLLRLADFAGARVVMGEACGIDIEKKRLQIRGRPALGYDLLSLDVGITPSIEGITLAKGANALAVKPISSFYPVWKDLLERCVQPTGPRNLVVIGGGAAGYEVVLAIRQRIFREVIAKGLSVQDFSFTLVASGDILPAQNARARKFAKRELAEAGVTLVENDLVVGATPSELILTNGTKLKCDASIVCTQGKAAAWFKDTGLPLDEKGFLAIRPTLQTLGSDDIFAVGDCAAMVGTPRPKAGVFAVRQGPYLAQNLRRRLAEEPLVDYKPQRHFLMLLSNAGQRAIAVRGNFALS